MKKVYICGLTGSGKGLVRPLLDGHPELIGCPFQGLGLGILKDEFIDLLWDREAQSLMDRARLVDEKTKKLEVNINGEISVIRVSELIYLTFCFGTGFKDLLEGCISGGIRIAQAQGKDYLVDFDCDWLSIFREIERRLEKLNQLNGVEQLVDIVYASLLGEWRNRNGRFSDESQIVISATNKLPTITSILKNSRNSKIIVVVRDVVGRAFSLAKHMRNKNSTLLGREEIDETLMSADNLWLEFDANLYSKPFLREHKRFVEAVKDLALTNENLTLVRFEDLFSKRGAVMDGLADFLSIERSQSLYQTTNNSILPTDKNFSATMSDDPGRVLTRKQVRFIRFVHGDEEERFGFWEIVSFGMLNTRLGRNIAQALSLIAQERKMGRNIAQALRILARKIKKQTYE
jgi:hypothetical protein